MPSTYKSEYLPASVTQVGLHMHGYSVFSRHLHPQEPKWWILWQLLPTPSDLVTLGNGTLYANNLPLRRFSKLSSSRLLPFLSVLFSTWHRWLMFFFSLESLGQVLSLPSFVQRVAVLHHQVLVSLLRGRSHLIALDTWWWCWRVDRYFSCRENDAVERD